MLRVLLVNLEWMFFFALYEASYFSSSLPFRDRLNLYALCMSDTFDTVIRMSHKLKMMGLIEFGGESNLVIMFLNKFEV